MRLIARQIVLHGTETKSGLDRQSLDADNTPGLFVLATNPVIPPPALTEPSSPQADGQADGTSLPWDADPGPVIGRFKVVAVELGTAPPQADPASPRIAQG